MKSLFDPLPPSSLGVLDRLPGLIEKTFPMPGRFRAALPFDVAELSRLLTAGREDRGASYLGKPALLSAYLRYFMPWNIYRLCRLFTSLPLNLKPNDAINDLGAGPLTLAAALWISRPELRSVPLEFRCVDRTAIALDAGKKFFAALVSETIGEEASCPWLIKTIRGEIKRGGGLSVEIRGKPAALSVVVNVYNELFWDFSPQDTEALASFTEKQARLLSSLTDNSGSVLVVEPGIPRSGEFISCLRESLLLQGRTPLAPCVHSASCPLPGRQRGNRKGGKAKWCHFAFDTDDAPEELHGLSAAAKIPKERAVLSFIFAGPKLHDGPGLAQSPDKRNARSPGPASGAPVKIRVISDSFRVQDSWGRYGCCAEGLVLVTGNNPGLSHSGALETLPLTGMKDEKSGAVIAKKPHPRRG